MECVIPASFCFAGTCLENAGGILYISHTACIQLIQKRNLPSRPSSLRAQCRIFEGQTFVNYQCIRQQVNCWPVHYDTKTVPSLFSTVRTIPLKVKTC